ncbi:MAG: cell envelope integrity protein CreD [Halioglobus sp.]
MNKLLSIKIASILLLALLILLPLQLIQAKISERAVLRDSAAESVAASWTGSQSVNGPVIALVYQERVVTKIPDSEGFRFSSVEELATKRRYFAPETLAVNAAMQTEVLKKGIYAIPVYTTQLKFEGLFDFSRVEQAVAELQQSDSVTNIEAIKVLWRISDPRGLNAVSTLTLNETAYAMTPGMPSGLNGSGMHLELPLGATEGKAVPYTFSLELRGMRDLSFLPVAKQTDIHMESDWPHPSFQGSFLPAQRAITDDGFTASWHVNEFASNASAQMQQCFRPDCGHFQVPSLGVQLVDPIDIYLQSERAVKYGFLFVALIFTAFFTFELLAKLRIHPVQYTLVGVSIAAFFLLLISLAEHLGFKVAYALSAFASLGVIAFYLQSILQSVGIAAKFSAGLGALYWLLYMILKSEDYALLMGAMLCFMVLAAVMVLTRNIDWYGLGDRVSQNS